MNELYYKFDFSCCDKIQEGCFGVEKLIENVIFLRVLSVKLSLIMRKKNMQGGILLNFLLDIFGYAYPKSSLSC